MKYRPDPSKPFTIGRYIWEHRQGRFSQASIAKQVGVSPTNIRRIEHDELKPDADLLWAIVQATQMRPAEAFRCARFPAAKQLSEDLQNPTNRLDAAEFDEMQHYVDIIMGRDPTD